MMQESQDEPPGDEDSEKKETDIKRVKAPNKKKFDEDVDALKAEILKKENELKLLTISLQKEDSSQTELKCIRVEKTNSVERRNKIDSELKLLTQEITKKKDALSRLEVNLVYKRADRVDEAIRRLETQLKTHNYKLSEEKKIVSEINTLNRSKKVLSQYLTLKKEFDEMKTKQKQCREERDTVSRGIPKLKRKEEEIRRRAITMRQQIDEIKQDIDYLYNQKRQLLTEYKKHEIVFYAVKGELRRRQKVELTKKREEEKKATREAKHREQIEISESVEPYLSERQMCSALILYLQRFVVTSEHSDDQPTSLSTEPVQQLDDGLYVLKKKKDKADEDLLYSGLSRSRVSKKSRRDKKKSQHNKYITHTPETLAQFEGLNLNAPSNFGEIQASIEQLHARELYYVEEAEKMKSEKKSNVLCQKNSTESGHNTDDPDNDCDESADELMQGLNVANDDQGRGLSICESESNMSDNVEDIEVLEDSIQISDSEELTDKATGVKSNMAIVIGDSLQKMNIDDCDNMLMPKTVNSDATEVDAVRNGDSVVLEAHRAGKINILNKDSGEVNSIKSRLKDRDLEQIQHIIEGLHTQELIPDSLP